jgi:hypothetical protein
MLQIWVIHHLQVIGEAARGEFKPVHVDPDRPTLDILTRLALESGSGL